ncbi:MAG: COQ9 family protein [Paracoccaceae bacterium]|nr:COQ9 family protein [Paracoccaceae bacterium]MDG1737845.1 COQ9 family protein [Paracoccaceae bacterium]MDG2258213.1 COQ9 family protein [Paracoccaceae bacterium]
MTSHPDPRAALLEAAIGHVAFDGWSEDTLKLAATDCDIPLAEAAALFPRGALDLALGYHRSGDQKMIAKMAETDQSEMRYRDRVALAIRTRLELSDKEAVRRGSTLFSLPQNAGDGAKAIWETADGIWKSLGDSSRDVNWYTKRMTLSAVYSSVVLYWLGDASDNNEETWAFLDRRIDNVMQFEKTKAQLRENPLVKSFMAGPGKILDQITAPSGGGHENFPGYWSGDKN